MRSRTLQRMLGGEQALVLTGQVSDAELATAFTAERSALARSFAACMQGRDAQTEVGLGEIVETVQDRLTTLAVPQ